MKVHHHFALLALCSSILAACGPSDAPETNQPDGSVPEAPPSTAAEAEGAVLENSDYVGLEDGNIQFHLHWVDGPIAKDPQPGAEAPALETVRTAAGASFDRVMFRFVGTALPGYEVAWETTARETCARQSAAPEGAKQFRVRLRGVNTGGRVSPQIEQGLANLKGVAQTCVEDDQLIWHLGVTDSAQVRVIELRSPPRLVVDVRQGPRRIPIP